MEGVHWKDLYYGKVLDDRWPLDSCWCVSERVDTEHPVLVILRPVLADAWITETLAVFASGSFPHEGQGNVRWVWLVLRWIVNGNVDLWFLPEETVAEFCHELLNWSFFRLYNSFMKHFLITAEGCGTKSGKMQFPGCIKTHKMHTRKELHDQKPPGSTHSFCYPT